MISTQCTKSILKTNKRRIGINTLSLGPGDLIQRTGKSPAGNQEHHLDLRTCKMNLTNSSRVTTKRRAISRVGKRATTEVVSDSEASRRGRQLFYGIDRRKNFRQAFPFLLQAANAGYLHSQNLVGYSYAEGLGVKKNHKLALYWFRMAAEGKHREAPFNVGLAYEFGRGTRIDLRKAARYYEMAARMGNPAAQCNLGVA